MNLKSKNNEKKKMVWMNQDDLTTHSIPCASVPTRGAMPFKVYIFHFYQLYFSVLCVSDSSRLGTQGLELDIDLVSVSVSVAKSATQFRALC